jgi:vitamin B12 transporter
MSRALGEYQVGTKLYASGLRTDSIYDSYTMAGYATVGLYGSKKIDDEWTARLKFDNIFNRQYQLAYGYNTLGRGLYLTFQYQPK